MAHWDAPSKSDEWYTPSYVFDALGVHFDLDVASPQDAKTFVPCDAIITSNSLSKTWSGFVWMNPPFGGRNGLEPWLERFFSHGDGIALMPDRTSAPWFRKAWAKADAVLFTPKISFIRPDGSEGTQPSNGTALMSIGRRGTSALIRANGRGLGILGLPTGVAA